MTELGYFLILLAAGILALFLQVHNERMPLEPRRYKGRVSFVVDGDTLILTDDTRLRLWGVDAPEKGEKGADQATFFLDDLVDQKQITYTILDNDKYGRIVARIFLKDGRDVNRLLIESGFTKEYCKYSKNYYGHCV